MNITETFAEFIVQTPTGAVSEAAVKEALVGITDCVGCMVEGSQEGAGVRAVRLARAMGGHAQATIVGSPDQNNMVTAAFVNGISAHAIDFDDTYLPLSHPSCTLVPTGLAVGEYLHLSGRDVVAAYVIGYEVQARIGTFSRNTQGWHTTGIWGTMGATAVAARLLNLTVEQTRLALGIAASSAAAAGRNVGTMTKPFHAGHANRAGMTAALLGQDDFTADTSILDGPGSFFYTYGGADKPVGEELVANLGADWHILRYPPGIKKYPTCYLNHRMLDALIELREREAVAFEDVESIEIVSPNDRMLNNPKPESGLRAKFSFQFNAAMAVRNGRITPDTFSDALVTSLAAEEAMSKVSLSVDPSISDGHELGAGGSVSLRLRGGKILTHLVDAPYGNWDRPLSSADLLAKYKANTVPVLGQDAAQRSADLATHLNEVTDVAELTQLLSASVGAVPRNTPVA